MTPDERWFATQDGTIGGAAPQCQPVREITARFPGRVGRPVIFWSPTHPARNVAGHVTGYRVCGLPRSGAELMADGHGGILNETSVFFPLCPENAWFAHELRGDPIHSRTWVRAGLLWGTD